MHYGDSISFRCTARGAGSTIIDMPFIKFSVRLPMMHYDYLLVIELIYNHHYCHHQHFIAIISATTIT